MVNKTLKLLGDNNLRSDFLNRIQDTLITKENFIKLRIALHQDTINRQVLYHISKFVMHVKNKIMF